MKSGIGEEKPAHRPDRKPLMDPSGSRQADVAPAHHPGVIMPWQTRP
jgi:hypothetical protein